MRKRATVGPTALLRAERSVIAGQFDGERGAYRQFLQGEGATPAWRATPSATSCSRPRSRAACGSLRSRPADVKAFIASHAGMLTRSVETVRPVRWLVGQKQGVALPGLAPREVLTASAGTTVLVHAADGPVRVRVLSSRVRLRRSRAPGPARGARADARTGARGGPAGVARRRRAGRRRHGALPADDVPVTGRSRLLARWPQLRLQL